MDKWTNIRLDVLVHDMSIKKACEKYELSYRTIRKVLDNPEPPAHRKKTVRSKPKLEPFIPIIHEIIESDKTVHKKQRHTGRKIFERLRDEYGYEGGITVIKDEIRRYKLSQSEVFMPLHHDPGWAQFDFGEAKAVYRGRDIKVFWC